MTTNKAPHVHIPDEASQLLIRFNDLLGELFLKWQPHQFQEDFLSALLIERKRLIAAETGRQIGKTEAIVVCAGLWGQLVPTSQSYYLAPELKQARKILWDSGRVEEILPGNWIDDMKEKNSTIYWSGSRKCFLTIDGCDKFDASRGISVKKGVMYFDECRDMKEEVIDTIRPALGVYSCPEVYTSTPPTTEFPYPEEPERQHWFCELVDESEGMPDCRVLKAETADNPHFSPESIERERIRYEKQKKTYIFLREYRGVRAEGAVSRQWPMLAAKVDFVFPHDDLMEEIRKDRTKLDYYCMTDPATTSVWAWLFVAINKYSKQIYFLDEIYETKKEDCALSVIWPRALGMMMEIFPDPDKWRRHYDEAEAWFENEIYSNYGVTFESSYKTSRSKTENFTLLTDIFLAKKAKFSDRCIHTYWELKNYEDDKSVDHQVDNSRYLLNVSNFSLPKNQEPEPTPQESERRYRKAVGMPIQNGADKLQNWQNIILGN